jgi:uncharacterized protein YjbI with pentapeptide repeats
MDMTHIDWYIFDECDLRDRDLSERNLAGAHFIKANGRGTFFLKAQLKDAHFEGADLRNAYFVGADLRKAHFEGADLRGTIFTGADLRGAFLDGSISDERTTWDDAQLGEIEEKRPPTQRTTDGIPKIDFEELLEEFLIEDEVTQARASVNV